MSAAACKALAAEIVRAVEEFHADCPYEAGVDTGWLMRALESAPTSELTRHVLDRLVAEGVLVNCAETFSLAGYDPFSNLTLEQKRMADELERLFLNAGLKFLPSQDVTRGNQARRDLVQLLLESGRLVRLKTYDRKTMLLLHADVLRQTEIAINERFPYPASFALKDIRDLLGSTRKTIVPLMEHMDATGLTVRSGDLRRLKQVS